MTDYFEHVPMVADYMLKVQLHRILMLDKHVTMFFNVPFLYAMKCAMKYFAGSTPGP